MAKEKAKVKKFLSTKTVNLIKKMLANVATTPEKLDQDRWPTAVNWDNNKLVPAAEFVCNSAYCSAGHIINTKSPQKFKALAKSFMLNDESVSWRVEACSALGLPYCEDAARLLFEDAGAWPKKFREAYYTAEYGRPGKRRVKGMYKAWAARWQYFLDTDGAEYQEALEANMAVAAGL